MQKFLNLTQFALVAFWGRHKWKHLFLGGIYTLVVAFYASVVFFTGALQHQTQDLLRDMPELWVQRLLGGRLVPISEDVQEEVSRIRGVKQSYARHWGYYYDDATGAVCTVWGTDTSLLGLDHLQLEAGIAGQLNDSSVVLGTGLLELRGLMVGDFITLPDSAGEGLSLRIVGAFSSASDLLTKDLLLVSTTTARRVLGLPAGHSTDLALEIHNPREVAKVGQKIAERYPMLRVVSLAQLRATYAALFGWRGGIFIFGAMISVLAFLLLVWERATGLSGQEKKELGILKGIGWQVQDVLAAKLIEGTLLALTATLSGMLLAYWHVFGMGAPLLRPFLVGWSVLYPHYDLPPHLGLGDLLTILFLSLIPYLTATIFPAWRGAITDPADAMR
ncbi:MAG: ABC transporter permease [Bernardetiaceae bacterium]